MILSYDLLVGNPSDETLFVPAILEAKENTGVEFKEAAGDRGMYSADNELGAKIVGIKHVVAAKL